MRIWIDTQSGTWGDADELVIIEAEDGPAAAMLVNTLENMSDTDIQDYGDKWGTYV